MHNLCNFLVWYSLFIRLEKNCLTSIRSCRAPSFRKFNLREVNLPHHLSSSNYFSAEMILSSVLPQVIYCLLCFQLSHGNSASDDDISAAFPEDWCDKRYGTPTRTTGECICKSLCDGAGCVNQHGLSFYSYKNCPTCACLPPTKEKRVETVQVEKSCNDDAQVADKEEIISTRSTRKKSGRADYQEDTLDLDNAPITISEWLEDNGRFVFAAGACLVLMCFFVMLLFIK